MRGSDLEMKQIGFRTEQKRFLLTNRAQKAYDNYQINLITEKQEKRIMDKALSEMNTKELFCALTGEYGPIRQAYVQTALRKYKEQHGEYAELTEMIRAAVSGELGDLDEM